MKSLHHLLLAELAEPATPPAGYAAVFANPAGGVSVKNDSGVAAALVTASNLPALPPLPFFRTGELAVGAGTYPLYNDSGRPWTVVAVRASVVTAPTGAAVIVDVNRNGTTIFGTQSARPTIAAGTKTSKTTGMTVTSIGDGDWLTVDIDQIGSTIKGSDLIVQITVA
jgi:hypothetical protein